MSYLYKRVNHDGSETFYYSGAGEVVAIVKQGSAFWTSTSHRTQISAARFSRHTNRADAELAAEGGFDVIDKSQHVKI
jgi:hypothetical protein